MAWAIDIADVLEDRHRYQNTGGVSENNQSAGFSPAFMDTSTGIIYLSRDPDGNPAPCHRLDGLPEALVAEWDAQGRVASIQDVVLVGFERGGCFYTREQAARCVAAG
jgi:hypothetical protein